MGFIGRGIGKTVGHMGKRPGRWMGGAATVGVLGAIGSNDPMNGAFDIAERMAFGRSDVDQALFGQNISAITVGALNFPSTRFATATQFMDSPFVWDNAFGDYNSGVDPLPVRGTPAAAAGFSRAGGWNSATIRAGKRHAERGYTEEPYWQTHAPYEPQTISRRTRSRAPFVSGDVTLGAYNMR